MEISMSREICAFENGTKVHSRERIHLWRIGKWNDRRRKTDNLDVSEEGNLNSLKENSAMKVLGELPCRSLFD